MSEADVSQPPRLQDVVAAPLPPELGFVLPPDRTPTWASSAIASVWDPGIGAPTTWIFNLEARSQSGASLAIVSGTFLAPDILRIEGERAADREVWVALGSWFLGHLFSFLVRARVTHIASQPDGATRSYDFLVDGRTFGLLDVTGDGKERQITVETIVSACALNFHAAAKTSGKSDLDLASRWSTDLLPSLRDRFDVRMDA